MHGVLAAVLAAGELAPVMVAAGDVDPASVRPSPLTSLVFGFLLVATVLLLWSFLRHLRRAQTYLGPARPPTADPADADADAEGESP